MDRLIRIDGDIWNSGLFLDQTGQVSPLWIDGNNIIFTEGDIAPFPGSVPLFTRPRVGVITGIAELSSIVSGVAGVCYGFLDTLSMWDETNGIVALGSGYTGIVNQTANMPATRWSIEQWNEWIVATNGQDPMQLCKVLGTGFAAMTSATSTQFKKAEIIKKFRQFLLAFNLTLADGTKQENAVAWCDVNDVETWVPAATNSARKLYIPDLGSAITCAEKFGDNIFLYSKEAAQAIVYAGYPNVFTSQPLPHGIGAYGKNCVTEVQGLHVGIGPRGIWKFDGSSFDYIDTPAIKKYLARTLNQDEASKIVVYNDKTLNHIIIYYPSSNRNENDVGLAFNYKEAKWSVIGYGRSVASDRGVLSFGVSGDTLGNLYRQSLEGVISSNNDNSVIGVASSGVVKLGYGQGGYGQYGYGGKINV